MTTLNNIFETIHDIYNSDNNWDKIASYLHENHKILLDVFDSVRKNDSRKTITLDYQMNRKQLTDRISNEADPIVKTSLIVTFLHHVIYEALTTKGNYYFTLKGQKEMVVVKEKVIYYINVSIKVEQNIPFHAFMLVYMLESLFNKRFYIGIDFEYTQRKIQLAQLNFEHHEDLSSIVMVVNPNELEPSIMNTFVNYIICNKQIKKILHGADSLDVPYMYEHLLENDTRKIIKFTKTFIDTRLLCEYYKLNKDETGVGKCSIYSNDKENSAIYHFGVISDEQQNNLAELLENMPHKDDIPWNIHKLSKSRTRYVIYDVVFLKYFYYRIVYLATMEEEDELAKKAIIELYRHVLYELTQFIFLDRRGITFLSEKSKAEVDPINNYMIRKPNGVMKLIDIFNAVSTNLTTSTPKVSIDKIIKVNYYKGTVIIILKRMVYACVTKICRVYKDKNTIWTEKLDNKIIMEFFKTMHFYRLESMFSEIDDILTTRVKAICT